MKNILNILIIILITVFSAYSQDIRIGSQSDRYNYNGGFYDFSDTRFVNVSVQVWGYVKYPGKYYIPENSRLVDLISYAGGPNSDANLDDVKLYRIGEKSENGTEFSILGMYDKDEKLDEIAFSKVKAGDILILPGQPKLYLRDNVTLITAVASTIVTVATFIFVSLRK